MPSPPYALAMASIDGDTAVPGVRTVVGGNVVQLSGQNTAFWTSQLWELYDFPAGYATPSGWTLGPDGVLTSTAVTPPTFTVDAPRDRFGKYAVRLTVNGGLKNGVSDDEMRDETVTILVKSHLGLESVFEMETNQFGTSWAEALKRDAVRIEAAIGHAGAYVTTTNATPTIVKSYSMPTNSRLYVLRASVYSVQDTLVQSGVYDVTFSYYRDGAGAYTQRANVTTTVYETTAGHNVTVSQTGTDMNLVVTGAAATNMRWHVCNERFLTFAY